MTTDRAQMNWRRGGCHCGAVEFEVLAPDILEADRCNCSICAKSGYLHFLVPKDRFRLLKGAENLTTYTFNTGIAQHTFCKTCGVKSFYTPRSHPDGISVNVNCLDKDAFDAIYIKDFDGQNWEDNAPALGTLT